MTSETHGPPDAPIIAIQEDEEQTELAAEGGILEGDNALSPPGHKHTVVLTTNLPNALTDKVKTQQTQLWDEWFGVRLLRGIAEV